MNLVAFASAIRPSPNGKFIAQTHLEPIVGFEELGEGCVRLDADHLGPVSTVDSRLHELLTGEIELAEHLRSPADILEVVCGDVSYNVLVGVDDRHSAHRIVRNGQESVEGHISITSNHNLPTR